MATFVFVHGAWSGGWIWKKVSPLLRSAGHEVLTPTLSGLGERVHLATADMSLNTHIQDIVNVLQFEELREVILVGHSYGGMVITGVADCMPDRLAHVVYLDAFVPADNQSLHDLVPAGARPYDYALARQQGDGWRLPLYAEQITGTEEDMRWLRRHWTDQPLLTFDQPIHLCNSTERSLVPHTYIHCTQKPDDDFFASFAQQFSGQPGWQVFELPTGHAAQVTMPHELANLLQKLVETHTNEPP
ncbi:MAG: alpha/beta hydrolase [Ktedonobacteraceae bacterium]|nr:alpha/beta hydrolase [Ktedonobacteraceae bacterium]